MTFVSYAQNYEDVMLFRALKHVEKGFYIDVGAYDPVTDSVTKVFYDMGWRGLNIEPARPWFEKLLSERHEDINLQVAAIDRSGELRFFEVVDTGLSTGNEETARRHARERGFQLHEYSVQAKTLTEICVEHAVGEVHFLKIDVEGAEAAALRGLDLTRIRPWVIVVEATIPNTQVLDYQEWERSLTGCGYHFVYFDGLNRFYIANEHKELDSAFGAPPNVFDEFITANEQWLQEHIKTLEEALQHKQSQCQLLEAVVREKEDQYQRLAVLVREKEDQYQRLEALVREKEDQCRRLEVALHDNEDKRKQLEAASSAVLNSRSWRVTRPLRWLSSLIRSGRNTYKQVLKLLVAPPLSRLILFASSRPRIKRLTLTWITKHPRFEARLRRFAAARGLIGTPNDQFSYGPLHTAATQGQLDLADLPPRAREIYYQLKAAIEQKKGSK